MNIQISGLEDAIKKLNDLQQNAEKLSGNHSYSFEELFSDSFMLKNTKFNNVTQMLQNSGYKIECSEDFEKIPDDEWDFFVAKNSKFTCWDEMMAEAAKELIERKLGL